MGYELNPETIDPHLHMWPVTIVLEVLYVCNVCDIIS